MSFGLVNGRPIFMDTIHDSYFALAQREEGEFLKALKRGPLSCWETAEPWDEAQAIGSDPRPIVEANSPGPTSSLLDLAARQRPRSLRDLVRIAYLQHQVRIDLARKPIARLLSWHVMEGAGPRQLRTNGEIIDQTLHYMQARSLLPLKPNCLVDTLTLARWLGPAPGLLMIFGVKLDPFAAHCWAQLQNMILNDRCDYVAPFRPVRVIECMPVSR